ncbi:class I SAM-dependent methyltransferase [Myxococcota bacterium]|nr:class I SAM-dependent methyltransferase [Myxococcota bacterium]
MDTTLPWPVRLFEKSILKQAKWRVLTGLLPEPAVRARSEALDLGADNGVISYLLRQEGGNWRSADLDEKSVASIQSLVGEEVYQTDGCSVPFADASLDTIVVIDMLEHVETDRELLVDLERALRPGGILILNVPHQKSWSALRRLRDALGLDDAWHGHVRPGYTRPELVALLPDSFEVTESLTYNRFFSELLDIALNFAVTRGTGSDSTSKGVVLTGQELERHEKSFRLYSFIYPLAWLWSRLDALVPFTRGYMLAIRAEKKAVGKTEAC